MAAVEEKYEEAGPPDRNGSRERRLVRDKTDGKLYVRMEFGSADTIDTGRAGSAAARHMSSADLPEIYRALRDNRHINIAAIADCYVPRDGGQDDHGGHDGQDDQDDRGGQDRHDTHGGRLVVIEEYAENAVPLEDYLSRGIEAGEFFDLLLQMCDALIHLGNLPRPVVHGRICAGSFTVSPGNVLTLTGFENAAFGGDPSVDIGSLGSLILSLDAKYVKRKYRLLANDCAGGGLRPEDLQKRLFESNRMLLFRNPMLYAAVLVLLAVVYLLFLVKGSLI